MSKHSPLQRHLVSSAVLVVVLCAAGSAAWAADRVFLYASGDNAKTLEAEASRFRSRALEFGQLEFAGTQEMEAIYAECNVAVGVDATTRRECNLRAANRIAVDELLELSGRKLDKKTFEITLEVWSPETNGRRYEKLVELEAKNISEAARKALPELASYYMCNHRKLEAACPNQNFVAPTTTQTELSPQLAALPVTTPDPVVDTWTQTPTTTVETPQPTGYIEIPGTGLMPDMSATALVWNQWYENGAPLPGLLYAWTRNGEWIQLRAEYLYRENCLGAEDMDGLKQANHWTERGPWWMPFGWHDTVVINPDSDGSGASYVACRNLSPGVVLMTALYITSSDDDTPAMRSAILSALEVAVYGVFGSAPSSYSAPAYTESAYTEPTYTEPTYTDYDNDYLEPEEPSYDWGYHPNQEHLEGMATVDVAFLTDLPSDSTLDSGYGALLRVDGAVLIGEDFGFAAGFSANFGYTSSAALVYDVRLMLGAGLQLGPVLLMALADAGVDEASRGDDVSDAVVAGYLGYEGRLRWILVEDVILDLMGGQAFRGDDTQAVRGEVRMGFIDTDDLATFGGVGLVHYPDRASIITAIIGIGL